VPRSATAAAPPADLAPERLSYSIDETIEILGISRATFYTSLINTGRLRTVMVGGRRLIPRSALLELLDGGAS